MGRLLIQPVRIPVLKNAFEVIRVRLHRDPSGSPILQGGLSGGVNAHFSDVCKLRETGLTGFTAMGSSRIQGITSRGWSLLFREREVRIRKRASGGERKEVNYVITRGDTACPGHVRVFNLSRTGAITITVDSKGRLGLRGYLKKNLSP